MKNCIDLNLIRLESYNQIILIKKILRLCICFGFIVIGGAFKVNGQLCDNNYKPSFIHVNALDCEGNFEICLHFTRTADFYTVFYFNPDEFTITSAPDFQLLSPNPNVETYYESINDLECHEDGDCYYCFTGYVSSTSQDVNITFLYIDPTKTELCAYDDVVIRKQIVITGTQDLGDLISSHDLLDATSAASASQNIYLNGTLHINEDYTFGREAYQRGTSNILMGSNAKIIVDAGKKLTLLGTKIKDCGYEWDRIELMDGSEIYNYTRGGSIKGGKYAIYAHENNKVHMYWTDFISNEWGIYAASETPRSIYIDIFGSTFDGGARESVAVGMEVYDLPSTIISNLNRLAGPQLGQFKKLKYGILAYNSNLTLMWPTMQDISQVGIYSRPHNKISTNSSLYVLNHGFDNFIDLNTAIIVENTDLFVDNIGTSGINYGIAVTNDDGYTTSIINSIIHAKRGGITINGRKGGFGNITSNEIIINQDGVINSGQAIFCTSSLGVESSEFTIQDNTIENHENGAGVYAFNFQNLNIYKNPSIHAFNSLNAGIRINGGKDNKISCNTYINGGANGINIGSSPNTIINCNAEVSGNKGLVINGTCEQSEIRNNAFHATVYDLEYGFDSHSYVATKLHECQGNAFNSTNDFQAKHFSGDQNTILLSKYIVPSTANNHNPSWEANATWFVNDCGGETSCGSPCLPGLIHWDTSLYRSIKNGSIGTHEYQNSILYGMRSRMYTNFIDEDSIPSGYESFVSGLASGNIGNFYDIRRGLRFALNFTSEELEGMDSLNLKSKEILDTLSSVYRLDSLELEFTEEKQILIDSLINEFKIRQMELDTIRMSREARRDTVLPICLDLVDEITPSNIVEANQKSFYLIMLPYLIDHNDTVSEADLEVLDTIANQCELNGGEAVFDARAVIYSYWDTIYDDETICYPESIILGSKNHKVKDALVIPNPTDNQIQIILSDGNHINNLCIFDISGRKIDSYYPKTEVSKIEFSTLKFPDGIYFLRIEDQKGNLHLKKQIVQH